jgi:bifunctional non-homologous end joining protein LigD
VCLDDRGYSQFNELFFRRGDPFFYAFDLVWLNGEDLRNRPLLERKTALRELAPASSRLLYLDHLENDGRALFAKACELDLEGIVAKQKSGIYFGETNRTTWHKIKNPEYSQARDREELFERA